jgi:uncharacterized membrane protein YecN with MAPEG domain
MDQAELTVVGFASGIALLAVGAGLRLTYGQVLPYLRDAAATRPRPPEPVIALFRRFMRAADACIACGIVLAGTSFALGGVPPAPAGIRVPVSLYYAAALGLLLLILSYNVLRHRVRDALAPAEPGITDRIARVHANFTEYVPTGLALLILLEWAGAPAVVLHFGGATFTIGRYLHAWGFSRQDMASFGRIVGIQATLFALFYLVLMALLHFVSA